MSDSTGIDANEADPASPQHERRSSASHTKTPVRWWKCDRCGYRTSQAVRWARVEVCVECAAALAVMRREAEKYAAKSGAAVA